MKAPSAPPLPDYPPPPAYPGISATYAPVEYKRQKVLCKLVEARKAAFVLSCIGVMLSFLFIIILFFEGVVLLVVCIVSAYAYYKKSHFLYLPHILFLVLNFLLTLALTLGAVVAIFAPELASAYIPYLPDIIKEWYRYFAIAFALICTGITIFMYWLAEIYYKAYKCTRDLVKHENVFGTGSVRGGAVAGSAA